MSSLSSSTKHIIYISIGSNIDKEKYTRAGLTALHNTFGELLLSSVFESESVGFNGHNFYNLVVKASTDLSIADVCHQLKTIERDNQRQRGEEKFSPRTLDLDLLLYDEQITSEPVDLPRPEVLYNAFVLWPLSQIAANQIHPIQQKSYATLWQEYDKSQQHLWPINFEWSST